MESGVPPSKTEQTKTKKRQAKADDPKPNKVTWRCPVSHCPSKSPFPAARDRRKYLINVHLWSEDRTMEHVPLSNGELARARARAKTEKKGGVKDKKTKTVEKETWHCPIYDCQWQNTARRNRDKRDYYFKVH